MKNILSLIVSFTLILSFVGQTKAQLGITASSPTLTAQDLAEIIAGPGVVVSNASITGDPTAIGSFISNPNDPGLGIGSGVILSSGAVADAAQPNGSFSSTSFNLPGDPFLEAQANEQSNDAVVLQFDFVPNADFVTFNYVFGSEEYPEWVCSFNDIFAFTIEGISTPMPQTNIALIPSTAIPVSINTVNNDPSCGGDYSQYYIDNTSGAASQFVVYDGLTVVMSAEATVICGETYRLRLMLSDGGDWSYDSGCFIEENSLTTGSVIVETATAAADSTAYEGCNDATVTLTLNGPAIAQDFPVPIWISNATAESGLDYDPIPALNLADSTIVIPAGQNTVSFTINPINDNITEGPEYIEFIVITSTCGLTDTFRIYINDLAPITTITNNDTTICTGNAIGWCEAIGGGGVFTYTWDNGFGVADSIFPAPTQTTTYNVSVSDNCNSNPVMDSFTVTVDDGPTPNAGNDVFVCIGGAIVMNASSDSPGSTFLWNPATDLSDATVANPICTPQADIEYIVTVTRPDGCSNDDTVLVTLTPPPTSEFTLPLVGCAGDPMVVNYDGNANAAGQYQWDFDGGIITNGSGMGPIAVYWPAPGIFDVELTVSWNGCISPNTVAQIEILGPPPVDAGPDISFCSDDSGPIGSAPLGGITYSWSPTNGVTDPTASSTTVQLNNSTHEIQVIEYVLTATEQGCTNTDEMDVVVFPIPTVEFAVPEGECFNVNSYDFLATGYFGTNTTFDWNFGPVGFPATSSVIQPQGVIFNTPGPQQVTVTVEDNSCVSEPFTAQVEVFEMPVADFVFDINDGCEPLLVTFENQSYDGNSSLYNVWSFGNGTSSTHYHPSVVYDAGVYSITLDVTTAQGCGDSVTQSDAVEVFEKPTALFRMNSQVLDILYPTVEVTNMADSIISSEFTFHPFGYEVNAMTAEFEYPAVGTYEISQIVTTANGCLDTIVGTLEVKPHYTFYIPNAFTPTDDRINEVWVPQGESISEFNMFIYDRWDEELFQSSSLEQGWDGTYKGKLVQQGTYVYKIDVIDILGEPHKYTGTFFLIR